MNKFEKLVIAAVLAFTLMTSIVVWTIGATEQVKAWNSVAIHDAHETCLSAAFNYAETPIVNNLPERANLYGFFYLVTTYEAWREQCNSSWNVGMSVVALRGNTTYKLVW